MIDVPGRVNFTLAHEFGHYLNHRHVRAGGFECSSAGILGFDADGTYRHFEQEANIFASYLLIPISDYRAQVAGQSLTLDLLKHGADRYGVSFTAAALKWIEFTEERAVFIYAQDGFVLWGRRSDAAKKSRVFYPCGAPLPAESLAALGRQSASPDPAGVELPPGVWRPNEPVREMTIFADRYDATISVLVLPRTPICESSPGDDDSEDLVTRIERSTPRR
jgi:hypothetical protein